MTTATAKIEAIEEDVPVERLHHDIPVDEAHVQLLMESIRQMGQLAPLLVRLETYELIDGFHRAEALRRLGIERALCRVITCTDEEFNDARITSAILHKSVDFGRVALWMFAAWEQAGWEGKFFHVEVLEYTDYRMWATKHTQKELKQFFLDDGHTEEEIEQVQAWVRRKCAVWGVSLERLRNIMSTAAFIPRHLSARVRDRPVKQRGEISEETARVLAASYREEKIDDAEAYEVAAKVVREGLDGRDVEGLIKTIETQPQEARPAVIARKWRDTEQAQFDARRAYERSTAGIVAAARQKEEVAQQKDQNRIQNFSSRLACDRRLFRELPFNRYPKLKAQFDASLHAFIVEALRYRGESPDKITQLEAQVAALTKENQELKTALDNMRRGAGLANRIYQDEMALRRD